LVLLALPVGVVVMPLLRLPVVLLLKQDLPVVRLVVGV
jgi:hypothetical protein